MQAKRIAVHETPASKRARASEDWDFGWIEQRFAAVLVCSSCGEPHAVAGMVDVHEDWDPESGPEYSDDYRPQFFLPAPHIITIPKKSPDSVSTELQASFALFWADPAAAANRIRVAVEALLTAWRIPRRSRQGTGKFRWNSLDARIKEFQTKHPTLGEQVMAIKWLGNAGSHARITVDDVLDGYDLMEHVLTELYVQPHRSIKKLTRSINARSGPRSSRKARNR